ncbi:crossover junction endodeoxyribonuclease RuvC [Roseococcus sp. SDR]|nr:crossover junction endodeoxyribonuclease RuvC [Roseococcus sp. SDR]MBV1846331.1 crossover junction endodeoxyribonuclease RuvC [Roseococcus sp. SDR]
MGGVRILGIDPGLTHTGWGVIESAGSHLRFVAAGAISTGTVDDLPARLVQIHNALSHLIGEWRPDEAAVEHTYVNKNPAAALKLGQARGVALLAPAMAGLPVAEYQAMEVKRAVVGTGHADKIQVQDMVKRLLPGAVLKRADAADALAIAICHAHHRGTRNLMARLAQA